MMNRAHLRERTPRRRRPSLRRPECGRVAPGRGRAARGDGSKSAVRGRGAQSLGRCRIKRSRRAVALRRYEYRQAEDRSSKTAKRGKLYGSDDAAWESEVRKDLAKKKTGTVDNAVSKRVAEVSQEVASYRATATAAVDAFVRYQTRARFPRGRATRWTARGARRGGAGSERIDGLRRDRQ